MVYLAENSRRSLCLTRPNTAAGSMQVLPSVAFNNTKCSYSGHPTLNSWVGLLGLSCLATRLWY